MPSPQIRANWLQNAALNQYSQYKTKVNEISQKCNTNVWKQMSIISHSLFYCWPCVYVTLGVGFPIRNSRHATSLVFHFFPCFPRTKDSFSGEVTRYSKYVEVFEKKRRLHILPKIVNVANIWFCFVQRFSSNKKSTNNYIVLASHCSFSWLSFGILRLI